MKVNINKNINSIKSILKYLSFIIILSQLCACTVTKKNTHKLLQEATSTVYDIIIVPGVPLENGQWSRTMKGRVLWANYLYDKGIAKNIMFSGSAVYSPYIEAKVMAAYGKALGIKEENIFIEPLAEHSTENIYYGYMHAKKLGFDKIALASDPFQSKMLRGFIKKKIDRSVGIIPIVKDSLTPFAEKIIDPQINFDSLYIEDFVSIKDREGFWKRFKGTQGRSIDKEAYK